jgi:hypothetical protein
VDILEVVFLGIAVLASLAGLDILASLASLAILEAE